MNAAPALTHPDKVLFTGQGITKRELSSYYALALPCFSGTVTARIAAGVPRPGCF